MSGAPIPEISKCVSPDGQLTFSIVRESGDVTLGFEGHPWHTHGDLLAHGTGRSIEEAVRAFIDALQNGEFLIAIASVDGRIRDAWVQKPPIKPDPDRPRNETIAYRLWDGTLCGTDGPTPAPPTPVG